MNQKEEIIEKLKQQARESWSGQTGEERAEELERFLREKLSNYAGVLGYDETAILEAFEKRRTYSCINYYQEDHFPKIDDKVKVFKTIQELRNKFPSKKFICPSCKGISTDPNVCNSGKIGGLKRGNKICDWKSYGLFGCLDGGFRFIVKEGFLEKPVVHNIFLPVELQEVPIK